MDHILAIDFEKCTGCRNCELACSVANYGMFNPARSRIQVIKQELNNIVAPVVCLQCETPLCRDACPNGAIARNQNGILYVDSEVCVGCGNCVTACVFGGISIDPYTKKAAKCNLCDGDPACLKACEYGAISYETRKQGLLVRHKGTLPVRGSIGFAKEEE